MGCDCEQNKEQEFTWSGSGLKYAVNMDCDGFDMDEDDWKITVVRGAKTIEFTPENAVQGEDGQWYICIDTSLLSPGDAFIIFDAFIPDEDFEDGIRHDIKKYKLTEIKSL